MIHRKPYILLDLKKAYDLDLVDCVNSDLVDRWCPSVAPTFVFLKETKEQVLIHFEFSEETGPIRVIDWSCRKSFPVDHPFVKELRHTALEQGLRQKIYDMKYEK